MPHYRIHRMKETPRENFRWTPHTGGLAVVKAKDYETGEVVEAANPYDTWKLMLAKGRPLRPGDLLEAYDSESMASEANGELRIAKFIGFEPAQWFVPEVKSPLSPNSAESETETPLEAHSS